MTAVVFTAGITASEAFPTFTGASRDQYDFGGDHSVYLYGTPDEVRALAARLIAAADEAERRVAA